MTLNYFHLKYAVCFILFLTSAISFSKGLGRTVHINRVFSEGEARAGFYTIEPLPECKWGLMYINLSSEAGKAMFSIVLTAKTANHSIVRIDYAVSEAGLCTAYGIHSK